MRSSRLNAETGMGPRPEQASSGFLLYLVGELTAGGQERQLIYLLRGLLQRGFRPQLAVWNYSDRDPFASTIHELRIPLHPLGTGAGSRKLLRLRRLVGQLKPSLLHSYTFYTNFAAAVAAAGRETLVIGSIRNEFSAQRLAAGPLVGSLSAVWPRAKICNSQRVLDHLNGRADRLRAGRVFVVRNGMDVSAFTCDPRLPERLAIVGVGRLVRQKRWDLLVSAVHRLATQGLEFHVSVAGEGPLRDELEGMARRLGVDDRIRFIGYRRDVSDLLAKSSFLVLTSDQEGCPNVIMEAMACGRAVVTTDAGEVPYLVEEGVTGFIVPTGNEQRLADRIASLLRSPELCARMGRAGRQRAETEFSADRLVDEMLATYRLAGWTGA